MERIRADEISKIIRQQLEGYDAKMEVTEVGQVIRVGDGIAAIFGLDRVMAGELLSLPYDVAGIALRRVLFILFRKMARVLSSISQPAFRFFRGHGLGPSIAEAQLLWRAMQSRKH